MRKKTNLPCKLMTAACSALMITACGDPLTDHSYQGEPLFSLKKAKPGGKTRDNPGTVLTL